MALLPDLALAGGIALAIFLITLGLLVVFTDSLGHRIAASLVFTALLAAAVLALVGEPGLGMSAGGFAGAVVANAAFEWLTTR